MVPYNLVNIVSGNGQFPDGTAWSHCLNQSCLIKIYILDMALTHWDRVTHICVGKLTIIGSDNGLSPGRRQAIIWTNAGILLIEPLGTNFSEILIVIPTFPFKKIHLKMSSGKWQPSCLGLNVLKITNSRLWPHLPGGNVLKRQHDVKNSPSAQIGFS